MNKILLRVLIIVAIVVLVLIGSLCALQIYREINVKKSSKNVFAVPTIKVSETVDSISFKKEHSNEDKLGRNRQTLWGRCTDATPKTVAKRYMIEKKLVPLQYES